MLNRQTQRRIAPFASCGPARAAATHPKPLTRFAQAQAHRTLLLLVEVDVLHANQERPFGLQERRHPEALVQLQNAVAWRDHRCIAGLRGSRGVASAGTRARTRATAGRADQVGIQEMELSSAEPSIRRRSQAGGASRRARPRALHGRPSAPHVGRPCEAAGRRPT